MPYLHFSFKSMYSRPTSGLGVIYKANDRPILADYRPWAYVIVYTTSDHFLFVAGIVVYRCVAVPMGYACTQHLAI